MWLSELIKATNEREDIIDGVYEQLVGHKPNGSMDIIQAKAKKITAALGMDSQARLMNPVTGRVQLWHYVLYDLEHVQGWSHEHIAEWLASEVESVEDYNVPEEHNVLVLARMAEKRRGAYLGDLS